MLHGTCLSCRSFSLGKPPAQLKEIFQGTYTAVNLCKKEGLASPWQVGSRKLFSIFYLKFFH